MKVIVLSRSGREIIKNGIQLDDGASVDDLKKAMYVYNTKWYPSRQRYTLPATAEMPKPIALESGKKISDYFDGSSEATVVFKDLGPQVGYKTVFFWEYFGPLALYPLLYFFPDLLYPSSHGKKKVTHLAQTLALYYWSFHYIKRIVETFFVHRFSHATMPIFNLFRNCAYYWSMGLFVSYFVNHPLYTPVPNERLYCGLAFALLCQLSNFYCHIILKNLRSADGKGGYQIPRGFLFNYITCANYTTEIFGWLGFNIATQTVAGVVFMVAGAYQMALWAIAKHKRLRKTFDGKDGRQRYPRRWVMIPPVF